MTGWALDGRAIGAIVCVRFRWLRMVLDIDAGAGPDGFVRLSDPLAWVDREHPGLAGRWLDGGDRDGDGALLRLFHLVGAVAILLTTMVIAGPARIARAATVAPRRPPFFARGPPRRGRPHPAAIPSPRSHARPAGASSRARTRFPVRGTEKSLSGD